MRRVIPIGLAVCWVLMVQTPLFAQDETVQTSNWFETFLWSDDPMGLTIIWLLLVMSAVSIGLTIKLALDYRRSELIPDNTHMQVEAMLSEKRYREAIEFSGSDPSYLGKVLSSGLNEASNGYGAMERAIEESSDAETTRMLRPIEYLNVLGNISPMLGLFGTVYGMIVAFQKLVEAGGKPDPAKLATGISTALVTTFWGLVVAVPALAAYALIRNKVDALASEGLIMAEELIKPFKPSGRRSSTGGGGAASGSRPRATPKPAETA